MTAVLPSERQTKPAFPRKWFRRMHKPTMHSSLKRVAEFLPILNWLPNYKFSTSILYDVFGGLTEGIFHVPQGIAYAYMLKLPAEYGLYASIFPALFYMFFGTSHHASVGGFAIITVMALQAIRDGEGKYLEEMALLNASGIASSDISEDADALLQLRCALAVGITLCTGVVQFLMAVLRLDFLTVYLSDQLVTGFSLGAAVHVIVTQMKDLVDLKGLPRRSGTGKKTYDFFSNLYRANWYAGATSLIGGSALLLSKWLLGLILNKYFHRSFPVPFELLLVIISTALSTVLGLHTIHNVRVVGTIPTGSSLKYVLWDYTAAFPFLFTLWTTSFKFSRLPSPSLPPFGVVQYVWKDSISIAIVIIAVHVSVAKILAVKHHYRVDTKQELYALGISNMLASFFPVFPVSCGLGRAFICSELGSKTQLKTIFSCAFLIVVLLFVGPYLYSLPMCILATIVVLVLKAVFMKIFEVPHLWRCSKIDCITLVFSCFATIVFNVVLGLIISVVFALLTIPLRYHFASPSQLKEAKGSDVYVESESYNGLVENSKVCVFRINGPILYMNAPSIRTKICMKFDQWKAQTKDMNLRHPDDRCIFGRNVKVAPGAVIKNEEPSKSNILVVIDFSAVPFVDMGGAESILQLIKDLFARRVDVSLANISDELNEALNRFGILKETHSPLGQSVTDAVKSWNSIRIIYREILDVHFENTIDLIINDESSWFL